MRLPHVPGGIPAASSTQRTGGAPSQSREARMPASLGDTEAGPPTGLTPLLLTTGEDRSGAYAIASPSQPPYSVTLSPDELDASAPSSTHSSPGCTVDGARQAALAAPVGLLADITTYNKPPEAGGVGHEGGTYRVTSRTVHPVTTTSSALSEMSNAHEANNEQSSGMEVSLRNCC